jgi:hypothetical protein
MKNLCILSFLLVMISCYSCNTTVTDDDLNRTDEIAADVVIEDSSDKPEDMEIEVTDVDIEDLYGYYVGMFKASVYDDSKKPSWSNKINISIDKIKGGNVIGHSVVAGNDRPFEGTIEMSSPGLFQVEAKEPGDDKYDGTFSFTIIVDPENKINGTWTSNDDKLAVTKRKYKLKKKSFKYNPNFNLEGWGYTDLYNSYDKKTDESEFLTVDVSKKNPSKEALSKADVENMKKGDLEVMRNSIYARHGYSFKNRKMRYVFNYVDWYIPVHTDIRSDLTDLEKKNIDLIKRYEQHAERYYDSFGR